MGQGYGGGQLYRIKEKKYRKIGKKIQHKMKKSIKP